MRQKLIFSLHIFAVTIFHYLSRHPIEIFIHSIIRDIFQPVAQTKAHDEVTVPFSWNYVQVRFHEISLFLFSKDIFLPWISPKLEISYLWSSAWSENHCILMTNSEGDFTALVSLNENVIKYIYYNVRIKLVLGRVQLRDYTSITFWQENSFRKKNDRIE